MFLLLNSKIVIVVRSVASSISGGGGLVFIYSDSAQLISFEIDCFYGVEHEYMNISPPPPQLSTLLRPWS